MISNYFHAIASSYLGLSLLEFIAIGVVIILVLILISLNRGGK